MRLKIRFIDGSDMIFEHVDEIDENDKYIVIVFKDNNKEFYVMLSNILFIEKQMN